MLCKCLRPLRLEAFWLSAWLNSKGGQPVVQWEENAGFLFRGEVTDVQSISVHSRPYLILNMGDSHISFS